MDTLSSNEHILAQELLRCVSNEAQSLAHFIKTLGELDTHHGYARLGYSSLFDFCTEHLRLTQGEAATRVRLVKLYQREPRICDVMKSGALGMCGIRILAPILNAENFDAVIEAAKGKSAREIELLKSAWQIREGTKGQAQPPTKRSIRRIELGSADAGTAAGTAAGADTTGSQTATKQSSGVDTCAMSNQLFTTQSAPLSSSPRTGTQGKIAPANATATPTQAPSNTCSPAQSTVPNAPHKSTQKMVRIATTISEEVWQKYEQAFAYANKSASAHDLPAMFEKMLDAFLEKENKRRGIKISEKKCAAACEQPAQQPAQQKKRTLTNQTAREPAKNGVAAKENAPQSKHSRYIPRDVAAKVWQRDGGRCVYISPHTGRRCECRRGLQVDHIVPFARGGSSRDTHNLRLLCPTHNRIAADDIFGREFMKHCVHRRAQQQRAP